MAVMDKQSNKYEVSADEKDKSSNILSKLKDPAFRSKLLRWVWQPTAMFTLGIVMSLGGPTMLDLRIITGVDEENGSFFFTTLYGGYLMGSFVAGGIHGRISNSLVMAVVTIIGGAVTIVTPYCSTFTEMLIIRVIAGCFLGSIDCTINSEHMRTWGTQGQALLMSVHFSFAIGAVIGPVFSAPFLTEEPDEVTTATPHYLNVTHPYLNVTHPYLNVTHPYLNVTHHYLNVTQNPVVNYTAATNSTLPHTTEVHYAYLIAGIILMLASIPFLVMLIFCNKPKAVEEKSTESLQRDLPTFMHVFLAAVLCAYYVIYCCVENTFNGFLETFLVDEFKEVTKAHAAYITSYYWAAFAAGRFTAIFSSKFLPAVRILYIQFCLLIIAISGFVVSAHYGSVNAVTGFTCLMGVALSSMYPSGFSWTEAEIVKVTGIISGVILVGSSIGSMISPYIMGYLMQNVASFWFCYFLAGAVAVTCLLFLFMLFFNRLYVNKKYGKFDQIKEQEKANLPTKHTESGM